MESDGADAALHASNLAGYEHESPQPTAMTFSREADNLEIGWKSSKSPSIRFFAGICLKANSEELVYSWRNDDLQVDHQLAFSQNTFITIR